MSLEDDFYISEEPPCELGERCVYQGKHENNECPADRVPTNRQERQELCAFGTTFAVAKQPCACKGDGSCGKEGSCEKKCCCKAPRLIQIEGIQR